MKIIRYVKVRTVDLPAFRGPNQDKEKDKVQNTLYHTLHFIDFFLTLLKNTLVLEVIVKFVDARGIMCFAIFARTKSTNITKLFKNNLSTNLTISYNPNFCPNV